MTDEQREEYLRSRSNSTLPPFARPILWAAALSFLWFMVLSPLVSAPWGPNLSADVTDRGRAQVSSCSRDVGTLWRMHSCTARIAWQDHGTTTDMRVLSRRELQPGAHDVVARRPAKRGRAVNISSFTQVTTVPADMPANTGLSVAQLTVLNVGAMVVLWTAAGLAVRRRARRPHSGEIVDDHPGWEKKL